MLAPLLPKLSESRLNHTRDFTLEDLEFVTQPSSSQILISTEEKTESSLQCPHLTYVLQQGPKTYILKRDFITLGRSLKNALAIPEMKSLSRTHCQIFRIEMEWYLEDCDSVNGTFLNDRRLSKGEKAKLSPDSKICLGEFGLKFFFPHSTLPVSEKRTLSLKKVIWLLLFGLGTLAFLFLKKEEPLSNLSNDITTQIKSRIREEQRQSELIVNAEKKKYEALLKEAQINNIQLKKDLQRVQSELDFWKAIEDPSQEQENLEEEKTLVEVLSDQNKTQENPSETPTEAILIPIENPSTTEENNLSPEDISTEDTSEKKVENSSGLDPEVLDQLQRYILDTMEGYSDPLIDLKDFKEAIHRLSSENNASSAKRMFGIYTALYQLISNFEQNMTSLERQKKELVSRIPVSRDLSPRLQKVQERLDLILKKIQIQEKQRLFLVQFREWVLEALLSYKLKDSADLFKTYLHPNMTSFQGQVILKILTDTKDSQFVPTLIRSLSAKDIVFRSDILNALIKMTGMNLGTAPLKWERWWNKKNPKSTKK